MSTRYGQDMYNTAISDIVIVGAGSAGLTAAYTVAKARPDLRVRPLVAVSARSTPYSRRVLRAGHYHRGWCCSWRRSLARWSIAEW